MSAPAGTKAARWNQVVSRVATTLGISTTQADTWLNLVWSGMCLGDEVQGNEQAHADLRKFLEANYPYAATLPNALKLFVL